MKNKNIIIFFGIIILIIIGIIFFLRIDYRLEKPNNFSENINLLFNNNLKDINSGKNFKIKDFKGKPILLEIFAVWCPTCTKQQKEIKILHEKVGEEVISISLDIDPSEDEKKINDHIKSNGFEWYYSISPKELTKSLIDEFGVDIVNAPQAPMILICDNLSMRKLKRGVKSSDNLKFEIDSGCEN